MEQRKRDRVAIILKVCMVVLLILALPSWSLSQPPQENENRGIIRTIWFMLTVGPSGGRQTADVVAGVSDTHGDRAGGTNEYSGPHRPPEPRRFKTLTEWVEEERPNSAVAKFRAKVAARRAKRALKEAQAAAHHEKKTAREQAAKAAVGNESTGCFPHDIRVVMADGTARSIADVKAGDVVQTYDIGYDQMVSKPVLATYSVKSNHLYMINNELKATGGERVLTESGWRALSALTQQDQVHINGQMMDVDSITYKRMDLTTYNLQVDNTHNFYVQTESGDTYLVHNGGGGK